MNDQLRGVPAVHRIIDHPAISPYEPIVGRFAIRALVGSELDRVRSERDVPPLELLVARVVERIEARIGESLLPVINATGTLLHTNFGRAPLAEPALEAARSIGAGYSNLEYDLISGSRGSRYDRVTSLLRELTGAQDAIVVNNCAAAVLLVIDTLARGGEAIVSRNQLVEIGGGFRLPDVLERSGAILVEVGATNKVYIEDFRRAISRSTAAIVRSHRSNFSIEGFVSEVEPAELVALGREAGVPVVEDLGSGALVDLAEYGLPHERTVQEAVSEGIGLVAFSGDKLLGGPQAGVIVGTSALVARLRANPLIRAIRVDKITIAMLAATLPLYRSRESRERIPFYRMLATPVEELRIRAQRYVDVLDGATMVESEARTGGGTLPSATIPSIAVAFTTPFAAELAERLRRSKPPIVGRIDQGRLLLDLRTVAPVQDRLIIEAITRLRD